MSFKVGDRVQLNTGGPPMTVTEVNGDEVSCTWFVKDDYKTSMFPSAALASWSPPKPVVRVPRTKRWIP